MNKKTSTRRDSRLLSAAVSAALSLAAAATHADPRGGTVTQGAATISTPSANLTQIDQTSHSVSIDWQSFDVSANERVNFNQPGANSVALNRILSQDPSQIFGTINANGRVFLMNPNGIVFGASARVNVGSLVATSLDLTGSDGERFSFGTSAARSGAIVNDGTLTAAHGGSVTLLGGSVLNNGLIVADYGAVNLGAGRTATLDFSGDGLMHFAIDDALLSSDAEAAVSNTGQILADGGQVVLTARTANDVIARAVNNEGLVRAARVDNSGGVIRLLGPEGTVSNSGTLDATGSNGKGGDVSVLGQQVSLGDTTVIDVSGATGGGTARIGGGFAGAESQVLNAQTTDVAAGAVIRADSTQSGDAGRVAVWADDTTTFNGDILARALGASGDGGFAEVSGREHLQITGHADLASANGLAGTLLLDPGSMEIRHSGSATGPGMPPYDFVNDGWVNQQLGGGNLTITTANGNSGAETLTVKSTAAISWNSSRTLTLIGNDSIVTESGSSITNTGSGGLDLQSNGAVTLGGSISLSGGSLDVAAGGDITQSAELHVGGTSTFDAGSNAITLGEDNLFTGAVALTGTTVSLNNDRATVLGAGSTSTLDVTSNGNITQTAAMNVTGNSTFTANTGQSIALGQNNTFGGSVSFAGTGGNLANVTVHDSNALTLQTLSVSNDLTATATSITAQALTVGGDLDLTATSGTITQSGILTVTGTSSFDAGSQNVTLGQNNQLTGAVALTGGTVSLNNDRATILNAGSASTLNVTSNGAITQGGALTVTGVSTFSAGANAITLGEDNQFTGAVTLTGGSVALNNDRATLLGAVSATTLEVTSSGNITQNAVANVTGGSNFDAGAAGITLDQDNQLAGAIALAGGTVSLRNDRATELGSGSTGSLSVTSAGALSQSGALTVGGTLGLTANSGDITQSAAMNVTGNSTFTAQTGQSVLLGQNNTFTGSVSFVGNLANVTVRDSNALTLQPVTVSNALSATAASISAQALTIGGDLSLTATSGNITQTAAMNVTGNSTFTAQTGQSILLGENNTFTGDVDFTGTSGDLANVTVRDSGALTLHALSVGNNLSATAASLDSQALTVGGDLHLTAIAGNITQTGILTVSGDSAFEAVGRDITLAQNNLLTGAASFTAATVTLNNNRATVLGASTAGALDVTSAGAISQNGVLAIGSDLTLKASSGDITQSASMNVTGNSTFTAQTGQSILLGQNNTFNGDVSFVGSGGDLNTVTVHDSTTLTLQGMNVGTLNATGNGITQSGVLTVSGISNFDAGSQNITLAQNNQFTGAVALTGEVVTLDNDRATLLGAASAGTLNVASNGTITQNAALNVTGNSTFTAQTGQSILLDQGNTFGGDVNFIGSGLDTITVRDLTALSLQAMNAGTLNVTAAGITQSGILAVSGNSSFDAGSQNITLGQSNQLAGTVALTGGAVTFNNDRATILGTGSASTLGVTSTGAITQSGILTVTGTSAFNASGQDVTLGQNNQLTGAVALTGGAVALTNNRATLLGAGSADTLSVTSNGNITQNAAMSVTGNSTFTAGSQNITLAQNNQFTGAVALTGDVVTLNNDRATLLGAASASTLNVASNGTITQNGALNVTGNSTFTAQTGQSILLDQGNTFGGDVNFIGSGLDTITVRDLTALSLQAMNAGTLNVTAAGITQSGILAVSGNSSFDAGSQNITLGQSNQLAGTVALTGGAVTLNNDRATILGAGSVAVLTVTSSDAITQNGALTVGGDLHLTAATGDITQSGTLTVAGNSMLAAGGNIVLTQTNALAGSVALTATDAALTNSIATTLAASTLDALTMNSAGAIGQIGALNVTGNTTLVAAGQNVTLNDTSNAFGGTVRFTAANASLTNSTATNLAASSLSGDLTIDSTGTLVQSGAVSAGGDTILTAAGVTLGTLSTGTLAITSSGAIGGTGPVSVAGASSLTATGQDITLDNAGNAFAGTIAVSAANVALTNSVATDLQPATITGDMTVSSTGALTQNGALDVAGTATLNSGGAVALDTLDAGALSVTAAGAITQTGALTVTGNTTLAAAGYDVTLDNATNAFSGDVMMTGANVTLRNSDALTLGASNVSGNLQVTSVNGTIAQAGTLNVGGSSSFTAADGQSILLTDAANVFGSGVLLGSSGTLDDVSLAAATGLNLQGLNIAGDLDVVSAGAVTQSGALIVAGAANFRTLSAGNDITLTGANRFGSVNATSAGGVAITQGTGDLNLRQVAAAGTARLEASNGSIVDDTSDAAAASVSASGVELHARNDIGTVTDLLTRQGSAIAIDTHAGSLSAQVSDTNGQVNLAIASGSNPVAHPGAISAGGSGRLLIQSGGDLSLNAFNAAITGFSEIGFSADGVLSMPGLQSDLISGPLATLLLRGAGDIARTDRTFNLGATHLIFDSGAQGGDVTLNVAADRIDATLGGTASLAITDADALTLGSIGAGGNVSIRAGEILDDGDTSGITRVSAGNALSLNSATNIGREDGSNGGRIDTAAASVFVGTDAGSAFITHTGDLQLSGDVRGGSLDAMAPNGNITVNGNLGSTGALTLTAGTTGNIVLAGTAQSGSTATFTAANGTISDGDDAAVHLSAQAAVLAADGVGSQANHLDVNVNALTAAATDGIYVATAGNVQLRSLAGQTVSIRATGAISDDGDDATRIVAQRIALSGTAIGASGNAIDTTATTLAAAASNGGIHVSQNGNLSVESIAATGDVTLTASGAISDDGDSATRISGNTVALTATALGTADAALGTQANSLTATAPGGIYVDEADALQLNTITATAGDVVIRAGGAITDDANETTRVSGATVTLTGTSIGALDNRVDTAASTLNANASDGGIFVAEQDSVTLHDVRSSGTGNTIDLLTANNGNITIETLVTQGGAVNLTAGGTGSLDVVGNIESNNGVINLVSGNALAAPGLNSGTGSVTLHTVNDLNVGTIAAGQVSITSDAGSITLGTIDATGGSVSITANNGAITDDADTSITAGTTTLSARSIGSEDNPLDVAIGTLTANASAGGVFIDDTVALTLNGLSAAGPVSLRSDGIFTQAGALSANGAISVLAHGIDMLAASTTTSSGGNILYVADSGDIRLSSIDAGNGRALLIAADNVYSSLDAAAGLANVSGSMLEIRAGGLAGSAGEIGTTGNPIAIATTQGAGQNVFLIVPAINGIQTSTPSITYSGSTASLLLKGYTGTGVLLFDPSTAFNADTIIRDNETIVPLRNGRVAVNSDSLSAAKQALSSGVVSRVNIDWAAFDPNVSLFGTLDPAIRLPADQIDELAPVAELIPAGTVLLVSRDGWQLKPRS